MIEIKAKQNDKMGGVQLECHVDGKGDDISSEAACIVHQMPELLERTSKRLLFEFLAKLADEEFFDKVIEG